jgi:hypothetical protein
MKDTMFEHSHISLNKWLTAMQLILQKSDISSLQLHRILGISKEAAWFMVRCISETPRQIDLKLQHPTKLARTMHEG